MSAPVDITDPAFAAWQRIAVEDHFPSDAERAAAIVYAGQQAAADPSFMDAAAWHRLVCHVLSWHALFRPDFPQQWEAFVAACRVGHGPAMADRVDHLVRKAGERA